METGLLIIISATTILSLLFLFLYFHEVQLNSELKRTLLDKEKSPQSPAVSDFLSMVIHEVRSPLSIIRGSADLLLNEASKLSASQISDLLKQIRSSSSDLLNMINDSLDVSKLEAGKFEIYKRDEDLNELLTDESHRFYALSKERNIQIHLELDPTIGRILMDPDKVRQVMNNLLSNALKFSPSGSNISIKSTKSGNKIKVSVCDEGVGIPDEIKRKLFNKFVQGREVKGVKEKGTGLGLVIVKGIVESHKGSVWIEDNKPHGSCFVFTIPLT